VRLRRCGVPKVRIWFWRVMDMQANRCLTRNTLAAVEVAEGPAAVAALALAEATEAEVQVEPEQAAPVAAVAKGEAGEQVELVEARAEERVGAAVEEVERRQRDHLMPVTTTTP
jgi:hypothetical protein